MSPGLESSGEEPELDLEHFKAMIRTSTNDHDSLNRSQDFVGTMSPRSVGRSPMPKAKAGKLHSSDRPDDWLGSPSSTRKSYKVKNALPHVPPPSLHDESDHNVKSAKPPASTASSKSKPPSGLTRHTLGGSSSHHKSTFATSSLSSGSSHSISDHSATDPEKSKDSNHSVKSPKPPASTASSKSKPPSGLTRHTLGGSSSHHESTFATSTLSGGSSHSISDLAPDPEKYKAMIRASLHDQDDSLNRSQEFLGEQGSTHGASPKRHSSYASSPSQTKHKWGAPKSPEQFRPDDWLGSPSSAKRKSYKVKSPVPSPAVPILDSGDADKDAKTTMAAAGDNSSPDKSSRASTSRTGPFKSQSLALGASAPKLSPKVTTAGASGRPTSRPVKAQSLALGQRSPYTSSPVPGDERVNRKKFVQAFSAFEGSNPTLLESSSPVPPPPHSRATVIGSPTATRNFKVSKEARAKSDLLQRTSAHNSGHTSLDSASGHTPLPRRDLTPLNDAISQLRNVALRKTNTSGDKNDREASEIMQMLKYLRHNQTEASAIEGSSTFLFIVNTIRREGIMETCLDTNELEEIHGDILPGLEQLVGYLDYIEPHRLEIEVCARILNQLSFSNPRSSGMIEDVIGRLRKVCPKLSSNLGVKLTQTVDKLEVISWKIGQREEEELSNVIRNLDPDEMEDSSDHKWDDLTRVMSALDRFVGGVSNRFGSSIFSDTPLTPPSPEEDGRLSPRGRSPTVSPRSEAPRNFVVSSEAKRKTLAVLDLSSHSTRGEANDELQQVLSNLRKVVVKPSANATKSEKQASELMQMIKHLRQTGVQGDTGAKELFDLFEDLKRQGVISSNLGPNRMGQVRKIVASLEEVRKNADYSTTCKDEIDNVIQKYLRKLTSTSAGAPDVIQQAIARLRRIVPALREREQEGMEDAISRLQSVLMSMQEGEEAQLAQVIHDLESGKDSNDESSDLGSLQRVLDGLGKAQTSDEHEDEEKAVQNKENAQRAKARLTPQDADYLVHALLKLKKVKMDKREAAAVAGFIRNMKQINGAEEEKASDEALVKVSKIVDSKKKSKHIREVLKGLRRLNLNDPERAELAEIVRSLGKGKDTKYRDEITDAISKLRHVQMTRPEAKEAAGIMFNLRKAKKGGAFDIDKSREMINLRKVMVTKKADIVAEAFCALAKLNLDEKEIDEFAGIVAELGVEALDPSEHQLITIEYVDGLPFMVLNIPDGDDYASKMGELGISGHVKKQKTYKTREFRFWIQLEPEEEDSDHILNDDGSDFEQASDKDEEERREVPTTPQTQERKTVKVKARPKSMTLPSKTASPKPPPKSPKKLIHYGDAQTNDTMSPMTEEKEKKIRFSNKHQWRFKKHNQTVVSEKRWRFEEGFNADEVIWSPLSRDQYDRRKTVGASILATLDKFAPLDDMLLDEIEDGREGEK